MSRTAVLCLCLALASAVWSGAQVAPAGPKLTDIDGKWIADDGRGTPRSFVFEARGDRITGMTCGPCDPAHVFMITDGSIAGNTLSFYIVHEDRGEALAKFGPYRDVVTGTVGENEIRARWHREGGGDNEDPHGEMVLIGPLRLMPAQPAAAAPAPAR